MGHIVAEKFINIVSTIEFIITGLFEDQLAKYYVNMLRIPIVTNNVCIIESKNMVENLAQLSLDEVVEFKNHKSST